MTNEIDTIQNPPIKQYTLEQFESGEPFEALFRNYGRSPGALAVKSYELQKQAAAVGFKKFSDFYKQFERDARNTLNVVSPGYTEFSNASMVLDCGNWECVDWGISRNTMRGKEVACPHPIMPVERLVNIEEEDNVKYRLAYMCSVKTKKWKTVTVDRQTISSSRSITSLNLKKQLESLADSASASTKKIDRSFDSLTIDDAADGLGESFEKEARKIEPIPEEIERDFDGINLEDTADGLADGFEKEAKKVQRQSKETESAVESLTDRIGRQRNELDDLKSAYVNARHQYGETADEAEKLAREIQALSGELAQSEREFREAARAADSFDRSLNDIDPVENFDAFFTGISAGITEGALDLLGELGEAFVDLGVYAIEASAEVQAANAQFAQTFKGLEKVARSSLEAIAQETGIAATRMQGSFTKIFAFAKAVGGDAGKALEIASRATKLAADNAAYFDKSIEEATETVYSFIRGNYENDSSLNLVANDMARNAAANERYAKSFDQLSGLQQADTLLAMAEAANAASGAIGQAAREAENWTNTTGELAEAWKQFQAFNGEELINSLTPIMQFFKDQLNEYVELRNQVSEKNNLAKDVAEVGDAAAQSAESVSQLTEKELELAAAAEATSTSVAQIRQEYALAVEEARQALDSQVGLFTVLKTESEMSAVAIVENWKKQKEALVNYGDNLQKLVDRGYPDELVKQLSDCTQESMLAVDELVNSTEVSMEDIVAAFQGVDEAKDYVTNVVGAIKENTVEKLDGIASQVREDFGDAAAEVGESCAEMQKFINDLHGKNIYINIITGEVEGLNGKRGGSSSGSNNPVDFNSYSMPRNIPYLASGAVIPPNAPFAAILGDQKHGTNIEAPLATIQEAVAAVLGDLGPSTLAGFEAVVEKQNAILNAIQDIQIGDTTIGRAAARFDRRQNLIRGGSTG